MVAVSVVVGVRGSTVVSSLASVVVDIIDTVVVSVMDVDVEMVLLLLSVDSVDIAVIGAVVFSVIS